MNDVFTAEPKAENKEEKKETNLEALVGEGKKFSDVESLAKGKLEADIHIKNLEDQIEELKKGNSQQDFAKELITKLEEGKAVASNTTSQPEPQSNVTPDSTPTGTTVSKDDLKSLVREVLENDKSETTAQSNIEEVNGFLTDTFGTEAEATVNAKAKELGVSKEYLAEVAMKSPPAFYTLIGEKPKLPANVEGKINSQSFSTNRDPIQESQDKWDTMRRENPKLYNSTAMYKQRMEEKLNYKAN